jgi:hypothetical protein
MFDQVDVRNATRGLGLYTLAALLFGWRTFVFIGLIAHGGWLTEVALLDLGMLVLGLAGCVGLMRDRPWGFIPFYAMAIVATGFFSLALLPFIPVLLPLSWDQVAIELSNLALVAVAVWLHWATARSAGR